MVKSNMPKRLTQLLQTRGKNYGSLEYCTSGGTRDVYLVNWGPNKKEKRILKVDFDPTNFTAQRAISKGYTTTYEIDLIENIQHPGVAHLLDYFSEEETEKVGISGSIVIEEYIEGSNTLEELIRSGRIFTQYEVDAISDQLIGTITDINQGIGVRDGIGIYHRDIKNSNILIHSNGGLRVKVIDWAEAKRIDETQSKFSPTAGSRSFTDPLLMSEFTGEEARYNLSSEHYSIGMCLLYILRGKPLFTYNPENNAATVFDTGESLLDEGGGELNRKLHDDTLDRFLDALPTNQRRFAIGLKRMLTLVPGDRYNQSETFRDRFRIDSFNPENHPDIKKRREKLKGLLERIISPEKDNKIPHCKGTTPTQIIGNRLRALVNVIAKSYEKCPEELKGYFDDKNKFLTGIATSAYHQITGDMAPIMEYEFGGFGATIHESEEGLEFGRGQLNFARLSGTALWKSVNRDFALFSSVNSGYALTMSTNMDHALKNSFNSGDSLNGAINLGKSLSSSRNSDNSLPISKNMGESLEGAVNTDFSLSNSTNLQASLSNSRNFDDSLKFSINEDESLLNSINGGRTLEGSKNSGNSLTGSKNGENSLKDSFNNGYSLNHSMNMDLSLWGSVNVDFSLMGSLNHDFALTYSRNMNHSLARSKNRGYALFGSENSDGSLENSENRGVSIWLSENSDDALEDSKNFERSLWESKNTGRSLKGAKNKLLSLSGSVSSIGSLEDSRSSWFNRFSRGLLARLFNYVREGDLNLNMLTSYREEMICVFAKRCSKKLGLDFSFARSERRIVGNNTPSMSSREIGTNPIHSNDMMDHIVKLRNYQDRWFQGDLDDVPGKTNIDGLGVPLEDSPSVHAEDSNQVCGGSGEAHPFQDKYTADEIRNNLPYTDFHFLLGFAFNGLFNAGVPYGNVIQVTANNNGRVFMDLSDGKTFEMNLKKQN